MGRGTTKTFHGAIELEHASKSRPLRLGVVGGVLLDELLLVGRNLVHDENRIGRAHRNAGATINAALGIDVELGGSLKGLLILLGVNAIGWASFDAKLIFGTGVSDYVCHDDDLRFGFLSAVLTARQWRFFLCQLQCTKIATMKAVTPVTVRL